VHHIEHAASVIDYVMQGGGIPNPPPAPPPGLEKISNTVLGWLKWAALVCGVGGLLICAIMIITGRRRSNAMASDGIAGAVWVLGGLALASLAGGLVGVFAL
jgi:hypothetical protein